MKNRYLSFFLALTLLFTTVFTSKSIFGEWGTAWNVGSFFLALGIFLFGLLNTENLS